jgi:hypothetical protein
MKIETAKQNIIGFSFIALPLLLVFGFASHSNLFELTPPSGADHFIDEFHNKPFYFVVHVVVLFCSLLVLPIFIGFMKLLKRERPWLSFIGGVTGIVGAFMLMADKAVTGLVPSAFEVLSEAEFLQIYPAIDVLIGYKGLLILILLYLFIPVGFMLTALAMYKSPTFKRWQAVVLFVASLLYINPDIDLISLIASVLLSVALIPTGYRILKGTLSLEAK